MIYTIQANKRGGWTMFRAAGITQTFRSLTVAKMLVEDCGGKLVVLDGNGLPMEVGY